MLVSTPAKDLKWIPVLHILAHLMHNECVCGSDLHCNIVCDPDTITVILTERYFCIFFSKELQTTLVDTCLYGYHEMLPRNPSKIKEDSYILSFHLHRTGQLCGECEDNYTLSAYSYYLECVKCEHYKNGSVKFIAAAFLPLTMFYTMVITLRISATLSTLNAFVMVNQVLAIPPMICPAIW